MYQKLLQEIQQSAQYKTPTWSKKLQSKVDMWGRTEENDSLLSRIAINFLSPMYIKKENITKVDEEVTKLYELTGNKDVLPSYA